ncbi:MAG: hypothetical protein QOF33_1092 [Thermomicrobiales bacterium]|jgi:predicted RNase H-like HicB family nuclease|nr:hypothetical protein [Thermomicrobiales bacterium]
MIQPFEYPPYSMILEWDPSDRIVVSVPELPGCVTHGATYEEAVKQGRDAIEGWVDVARTDGDPLPEPHSYANARAVVTA